ncbi:RcnB family protein [Acinetobacter colistiniresistens]|uniref:RcnB family protein n=1 Tax=Acinetobacter TaxID=469 RepID=UPI0005C6D15C|nr:MULTISPECIES: RcnB family protein [Acinetobacter]UUM28745.1 RcnB family protein [Acinetobacter colistiniresistens]
MMQSKRYIYGLAVLLGFLPVMSYADNAWGGYRGVERHSSHQTSSSYQPPAQDPFAFSNQRDTPTAPPKGYYYQPNQNNYYPRPNHRPGVRVEYYPETQYERSYRSGSFVVGNELPGQFRNERYIVRDWDYYSLREPPRGRHWVMVDGRYLLVTDDSFTIEIIR